MTRAQAVSFVTQRGREVAGTAPVQLRLVRMYTFGAPRVGNSEFAAAFEELRMEAFRVVNGQDSFVHSLYIRHAYEYLPCTCVCMCTQCVCMCTCRIS